MTMTPERLAEIREMVAALNEPYDQRIGSLASVRLSLYSISNTRDLLAHIDDLTRQLEDARRLALPAFTSPEGDLSEHTHVLDEGERCKHGRLNPCAFCAKVTDGLVTEWRLP